MYHGRWALHDVIKRQFLHLSESMSATGFIALLTTQVECREFSQCYDDLDICFWTDGSKLTQSEAQAACQRRNSFLPRITNHDINYKLVQLLSHVLTSTRAFQLKDYWIDVTAVDINNWHWVDDSPLAGWFVFVREYTYYKSVKK